MSDTLHDFFVGLGFKLDTASQAKAESGAKRTEEKITKDAEKESQKRVKAEAKAAADREKQRKASAKSEDDRWKAMLAREKAADEKRAKTLKNFETAASKTASAVTGAFAAITAGAMGVVYAVDRAAKSFEKLNYTGMRSDASAGKVGAFGYAAGQLGSSKEEAEGQLQTFGQNLKLNSTGYGRALERLGIKTRDANGQLRDSVDLATDLGDALRKIEKKGPYGYANAMNQARVFGFEGDTARALMNPEFRKRAGQFGSDQSKIGADSDAAAKSGTAFEQSMRHLEEVLGQIGTKIDSVLFKKLKPLLDQLAEWFTANGDRIADIVSDLVDDLVKLATALADKLANADWKAIFDNLGALAKSFSGMLGHLGGDGGLIAKIGLLAVALRALAGLAMPPWALAILGIGAAGAYGLGKLHEAAGADNPNTDSWEGTKRHANDGWFGRGKGGRKGLFRRGKEGPPGVDYEAKSLGEAMNLSEPEYNAFREGVTDIEGKDYNHMGGFGGRYAGRYQMGPSEITETARRLGVPRPSNAQFLADPGMQEKFFENYTLDHYRTLMRHPKFAAMSKRQKLQILGYAHNQGTGGPSSGKGAWAYLNSGHAGSDGWGTSGTAYFGPIGSRFDKTQVQKTPPMLKAKPLQHGRDPFATGTGAPALPDPTKLQGGADGKPVVLAPQQTSMRGDTTITNSPTFHIAGGDVRQNMEAARLSASRGQQDLLRNVQGALA